METLSPPSVPCHISPAHYMPLVPYSPGPHNPTGYLTGWVCDICRFRSATNTELTNLRWHCAQHNSDLCLACVSAHTATVACLHNAEHRMTMVEFVPEPNSSYEEGWLCDVCREDGEPFPVRWHCPLCECDVCPKCIPLVQYGADACSGPSPTSGSLVKDLARWMNKARTVLIVPGAA
eukprot:gnl/Spiro4/7079_TR3681_c0_g2_i1.p1 gnl/Spiro4/7079_TR3681_c0_g2~~gnl/Spiro4/7079_TR3681_c0_g2_i1.p1  ORF type:complete len:190 (+),score=38.96 gnl/Spiro4/7079_TR3681_c0_g2_i1:38-571(+)